MRILLTTDNHVGYNENDSIRGDDAAITFEEIMKMAKDLEVDMVLQSGDLFHFNKPSKKALYEVIHILRSTCLGDKPCSMQVLNHGLLNVNDEFNHVNYTDRNINVAVPVFGISGNHDDSGGSAMLSPMDILSATGLLNYYGRVIENDNIVVTPILLRKGTTKIALYGISNVRDERLFRTFREGNVKFLRPNVNPEEWFNIIAVHQNHSSHTETSYLPEHFIPDFMHVVIWGHEHECLIDPIINPQQGFSVIQPGSSVATSLSEGEAVTKHVGILSVTGTRFELEKVKLTTVRPFEMATIVLADSKLSPGPSSKGDVTRFLTSQVESLIEKARQTWLETHHSQDSNSLGSSPSPEFPLPLIRLRVEYGGGYEVENPTRFSNRFVGKVANVNDVVHYFRRKRAPLRGPVTKGTQARPNDVSISSAPENWTLENVKVQSLVSEYLQKEGLNLLQENALGDAISSFVDKDDKSAVKAFVDGSLALQLNNLLNQGVSDESDVLKALDNLRLIPSDKRSAPSTKTTDIVTSSEVEDNKSGPAIQSFVDGSISNGRIPSSKKKTASVFLPTTTTRTVAREDQGNGRRSGRGGRSHRGKRAGRQSAGSSRSIITIEQDSDEDLYSNSNSEKLDDEPAATMPLRRTRRTRAAAPKSMAIISDSGEEDGDDNSENVMIVSDSESENHALPASSRRKSQGSATKTTVSSAMGTNTGTATINATLSTISNTDSAHSIAGELDDDDGFE